MSVLISRTNTTDLVTPYKIKFLKMGQSDINKVLSALASDPSFQDTVVVCQDGQVSASRVVLALAFPTFMARVLGGREDKVLVVFTPDMLAQEVTARVAALFQIPVKNLTLHKDFPTNIDDLLHETLHKLDPLVLERTDTTKEKSKGINQETRNNRELSPPKVISKFQTLLHKNTNKLDSSPKEDKGNFETTPLSTDGTQTDGCSLDEYKRDEEANTNLNRSIPGMNEIKTEKKFEVTWTCKLCGELTIGKVKHNQHIKTVHQAPDLYSGSFCLKEYRDNNTYKRHVTRHFQLFTCEVCAKKFSTLDSLVRHTETQHNKKPTSSLHPEVKVLKPVSRVSCDECGFTSTKKSSMDKHKEIMHHEKNVKCKKCFKEFKDKFTMKTEHTQCSGLKCEMSPYDFTALFLSEMKRHYKYKH